ncbi:hypothetical protein KEM09_01575 [Carboxylicivirga mesophila]|uniref:DUF302 domain-containing protein n=1 Tax=Carboxylicivirga mesophila TaxID=1166478 RepID=A0ABS5K4Y9_9BACT|nr:hypothetical protein [Carboxylicivirga mesophila]MBS2210071.1 hypothetical protein [Carboxylicivirga mesophila]
MRWLVVIGFCLISLLSLANGVNDVRIGFHSIGSEQDLKDFLKLVEGIDDTLLVPYQVAASMQRAKYATNPFKKLKYFNEGKEQLEAYIISHPNNIEGYYVRLLIQSEVPAFLGYNENMESDISFVNEHIGEAELPDTYKQLMKANITKIRQNYTL